MNSTSHTTKCKGCGCPLHSSTTTGVCSSSCAYEVAVKQATTDQGLDPIVAALTEADIVHTVEQTGGFCMCVNVPLPDGGYLGITDAEEFSGNVGALVYRFADPEDCDGELVADGLPIEGLAAQVQHEINK